MLQPHCVKAAQWAPPVGTNPEEHHPLVVTAKVIPSSRLSRSRLFLFPWESRGCSPASSTPATAGAVPARRAACSLPSFYVRVHLNHHLVNWDQLAGAAGPLRVQVWMIQDVWWWSLVESARRTWRIMVFSLLSCGIRCGISAHLAVLTYRVSGRRMAQQELFSMGVAGRKASPSPFLSCV